MWLLLLLLSLAFSWNLSNNLDWTAFSKRWYLPFEKPKVGLEVSNCLNCSKLEIPVALVIGLAGVCFVPEICKSEFSKRLELLNLFGLSYSVVCLECRIPVKITSFLVQTGYFLSFLGRKGSFKPFLAFFAVFGNFPYIFAKPSCTSSSNHFHIYSDYQNSEKLCRGSFLAWLFLIVKLEQHWP